MDKNYDEETLKRSEEMLKIIQETEAQFAQSKSEELFGIEPIAVQMHDTFIDELKKIEIKE